MKRAWKEVKWLCFEEWSWMETAIVICGFIAMFKYLS